MTITSRTVEPGIVAVTVDYPPVNAIPSRGWFELADTIPAAGREMATHVAEPADSRPLQSWIGSTLAEEFDLEGPADQAKEFADLLLGGGPPGAA